MANQSRIRVTALRGLAVAGRALDSSPNSSVSDPNRHRAHCGSIRVRIEARDESALPTRGNATASKAKNKKLPIVNIPRQSRGLYGWWPLKGA
jgi:hypothetical protein